GQAAHGHDTAVAHDEVLHFDRRGRRHHSPGCCTARRATVKSTASAAATASVCTNAIAAVSSVLVENHDSTIAGVITLAFGPINRIDAPNSRTLAMNRRSQAATSPGLSSGMVTVRIRYPQDAPHICADSSSVRSIWSITPEMVRRPRGRKTVR